MVTSRVSVRTEPSGARPTDTNVWLPTRPSGTSTSTEKAPAWSVTAVPRNLSCV